MLFKPLTLAATAAAFVIIPEISEHDENIFKALPILSDATSYDINPDAGVAQSVSVPCTGCHGKDTNLHFDFTASDSRLLLNGFELYPNADPWSGALSALVGGNNGESKHQNLGYSLAVYPNGISPEDRMELIDVEIKVIEVGNAFIDTIPPVKVELVKAPSGELFIGRIDVENSTESGNTQCTSMWCQAQELAENAWDRIKSMKGCHKHTDDDAIYVPVEEMDDIAGDIYFPETYDNTDMRSRDWPTLLMDAASHVIIPIIMGVTAVRGRGSENTLRRGQEYVNATPDEKAKLMEPE
ncbi:hypothetical protein K4F52_002673 [Lecanicillium sp. MT-2017a]|nr:hypothetical protein K4F52_002673 [Lecanicillium sp. MT-2017a]